LVNIHGKAETTNARVMNDNEYDVLDELYFVQSYSELENSCGLDKEALVATLIDLYNKKWIKVLKGVDEEEQSGLVDLLNKHAEYFYLATKAGLLKHNGTS
jgi:hypothetical protein